VAPADGSSAHEGSIPGLRERRSTLREGREGVRLAWAPERARGAQQRKPSERDHAYSGRACTWEGLPSPPSWLLYHMHSGDGTEVLQSNAELS